MAEPLSVSVFLSKYAVLMAKEAGKALAAAVAKEMVNLVFGHLATRADVERAVAELKSHIDQRWDEFYENIVQAEYAAALTHLNDFRSTGNGQYLHNANERIVIAGAWLRGQITRDLEFARTHFVLLVSIMAVDIAVRAEFAAADEAEMPAYKGRVEEYRALLEQSIQTIENWEHETVGASGMTFHEDLTPRFGMEPTMRRVLGVNGWYWLLSRKYPNGQQSVGGPMRRDHNEAQDWLSAALSSETSRIEQQARDRETLIYAPAREVLSAMNAVRKADLAAMGVDVSKLF